MDCINQLSEQDIRFIYNYLIIQLNLQCNLKLLYNNTFNKNKFINKIQYILSYNNIDITQIFELLNIEIFDINYYYKLYNEIIEIMNIVKECFTQCAICYDNKYCKTFWKCDHYICESCYKSWKKNCPLCRITTQRKNNINKNTIIIIVFKGLSYGYYMKVVKCLYNGFNLLYINKYINLKYLYNNELLKYEYDYEHNHNFNYCFISYNEILKILKHNTKNFIIYK